MRQAHTPELAENDLLRDDNSARQAFRDGHPRALAKVYEGYVPLVRTIVCHGFGGFRGFRSPADQEDMIQTVFAEAFEERCRLRYDGLGSYAAFIRGIAQNKIRQRLSQDQRFSRTDGAPPPSNPSNIDPESALIYEERKALMAKFRTDLSDETERAILDGYYVHSVAEETLASELGITRYRVRKLVASLHTRMLRHLRRHDVLEG